MRYQSSSTALGLYTLGMSTFFFSTSLPVLCFNSLTCYCVYCVPGNFPTIPMKLLNIISPLFLCKSIENWVHNVHNPRKIPFVYGKSRMFNTIGQLPEASFLPHYAFAGIRFREGVPPHSPANLQKFRARKSFQRRGNQYTKPQAPTTGNLRL